MSRIGKLPITVPSGVAVTVNGSDVTVKGPKGELSRVFRPELAIALDGDTITVTRSSEIKQHRAYHGLTRSLLNNMVLGVSQGFSKDLEIQGVGYKAEESPKGVKLIVGYSNPVNFEAPAGVKISVENNTKVKVVGIDKQMVGHVAAEIRKVRPPEPYKGKGIRYLGEAVRRKAGKTGAK
jgi:large subunit ribosomal protein L6